MALIELTQRIHTHIPITQYIGFKLAGWEAETLTLAAPLAVNSNDKGSFFAGSQVTLCTLAGWALTTLLAEQVVGEQVDVVAVNSDIHYQIPLLTDAVVTARGLNSALFLRRIKRRGKAKLKVEVEIRNQANEITSVFSAVYYARYPQDT